MSDVTMRQMLEAGVHFGHQTRYWNPKMGPYIFGERNKIHIINLEHSLPLYREAMNFLGHLASNKGVVLFVGTKRQASAAVQEQALRCGCPYVNHRWLGGMLTNFKTVKNSIRRLKELDTMREDGSMDRLSKKEALQLQRESAKLERGLAGIKDMNGLPDALFVIDVKQEYIAVSEANKLHIPVVAVVDTNCSPAGVDHIIPGNDDAIRAIKLYLDGASDAITEGRNATASAVVTDEDEYVEVDRTGSTIISQTAATGLRTPATYQIPDSADDVAGLPTDGVTTESPTEPSSSPTVENVAEERDSTNVNVDAEQQVSDKDTAPDLPAKSLVTKDKPSETKTLRKTTKKTTKKAAKITKSSKVATKTTKVTKKKTKTAASKTKSKKSDTAGES